MSSVCISNCVNDARDPRMPSTRVRATYVSLYRWPESDLEFVRSARRGGYGAPRVVDTISCRQMYLRSYTFSREEDHDKTASQRWCFGGAKETTPRGSGKGDKTPPLSCFSGKTKEKVKAPCREKTTSRGRSSGKENTAPCGNGEEKDENTTSYCKRADSKECRRQKRRHRFDNNGIDYDDNSNYYRDNDNKKKKRFGLRRVKEVSCSALFRFFHRLLSCAATVDVVDHKG